MHKYISNDNLKQNEFKPAINFLDFYSLEKDDFNARVKYEYIHGEIRSKECETILLLPA